MIDRMSSQADLRASVEYLRDVYHAMPGAVLVIDPTGHIQSANGTALALLEATEGELVGRHLRTILSGQDLQDAIEFDFLRTLEPVVRTERSLRTLKGDSVPVLFSASPMLYRTTGQVRRIVCIALDLRERKRLEAELWQAQRHEAVGRLAAGIAHDINTPIQFVGDAVHFLQGAVRDLFTLIEEQGRLAAALPPGPEAEALAANLRQAAERADLAYVTEQTPRAFERIADGLGRIGAIVQAMREFSTHTCAQKVATDINRALRSTLVVARSQYKYVATVETSFGDLPLVSCCVGEINQVLLALLINAAQAIGDRQAREPGLEGVIRVSTAVVDGAAEIAVADNGCGIPASLRERVFEPFFTTKDPGRGSGHGLAIARTIVVERHAGALSFSSEVGRGTTFRIRLPLAAQASPGGGRGPAPSGQTKERAA